MSKYEQNRDVQLFRQYLQIPTVHPDIDYGPCLEFLKGVADEFGFPYRTICAKTVDKPTLIVTWEGQEPEMPSIILSSHMDVVPVNEELWTHPPFAAETDENGKIFARGSQDMKNVGIQYLLALRDLKTAGFQPKRTIHVCFNPEEETGSDGGVKDLVHTDEFKALNVGFALDEGGAFPGEQYYLFYAERSNWHVTFKVTGTEGHGSLPLLNTAGEKLTKLLGKIMDFREKEICRFRESKKLIMTDVTNVNLTMLSGGLQRNIVPDHFTLSLDIRVAIDVDHNEFEQMLLGWCKESGGGIDLIFDSKEPMVAPTKMDESNPFWKAFEKATKDLNLNLCPIVCPGTTDARFYRSVGIPAFGFSPMNHTPLLCHCNDEYLEVDKFLEGIGVYKKIIQEISSV